jgi:hypothetical protein
MRVLVECCLQEKVFNKYYTVLASKLCEHDKNHKFTLQVFFLYGQQVWSDLNFNIISKPILDLLLGHLYFVHITYG